MDRQITPNQDLGAGVVTIRKGTGVFSQIKALIPIPKRRIPVQR
jgi:hypothetical protein